ncbi:hypothetical protein GN109_14985 [Collimonas pratensis]|uniref:DUF5625 family protein n=1 Tax=Collimonas pratensis TaxID=279113 RepID=UPI00143D18B7|nr:DUF5625 family protein [Collimonas pratensis]NKI70726.1 hypothetical protein [Collimonas pratensis]
MKFLKSRSLEFGSLFLGIFILLPFLNASALPFELSALTEKLPHVVLPFNLEEKGYIATTDFVTGNKAYTYTFYLNFQIKNNQERIAKLLGLRDPDDGGGYKDADGQFVSIRTGIHIPLRLTVSRLDGENEVVVYDENFHQLRSLGGNDSSFLRTIDRVKLEPGHYRIRLEALAAVKELAEVPVNFEIGIPGKH